MKILIVGSGGREHAITWRLSKDEAGHSLFCAPGNAGTAAVADAGAGLDPRITDLYRTGKPLGGPGSKGIDGDHEIGRRGIHRTPHKLNALQPRFAQNTGAQRRDLPKPDG